MRAWRSLAVAALVALALASPAQAFRVPGFVPTWTESASGAITWAPKPPPCRLNVRRVTLCDARRATRALLDYEGDEYVVRFCSLRLDGYPGCLVELFGSIGSQQVAWVERTRVWLQGEGYGRTACAYWPDVTPANGEPDFACVS